MKTSPVLDEFRDEFRALGRAEGIREMILRLGRKKFGKAPSRGQQRALEAVSDIGRMEALAERLLVVDSWGDLLGER